MSALKPADYVVNCGRDIPFTLARRGPIEVKFKYESLLDPKADFFIEIRCGRRRQRTAFTRYHDAATAVGEMLTMLGFEPKVTLEKMNLDEEYAENE